FRDRIMTFAARNIRLYQWQKILRRADLSQPLVEALPVFRKLELFGEPLLGLRNALLQHGGMVGVRACVEALARRVILAIGVGGIIEEREQLVILAVDKRVVRVAMALHTPDTRALHRIEGGIQAIEYGVGSKFLVICAAFVVGLRVPMKSGCNDLIF